MSSDAPSITNDETGGRPFELVSDIEVSQREKFLLIFDEFVRAPSRIVWEDIRARVGGFIFVLYLLMGTVGVVVTPKPEPMDAPPLLQPFHPEWFGIHQAMVTGATIPVPIIRYPLGTDNLGQGLFGLIVHATPAMLKMIFAGAFFAATLGTFVGMVAGYSGGRTDLVLSTLADIILTLPGLPLTIVIVLLLQPESSWIIGIILMSHEWGGLTRTVRSETLSIRKESYVEASRAMGIPTRRIVVKDLLPNLLPYVFMSFMRMGREVIFAAVGLYFLGLLPFTNFNWGVILNQAWSANAIYGAGKLHWLLVPLFVIVLFTYALTLLAQSTDRLFNPKVRARHENSTSESPSE